MTNELIDDMANRLERLLPNACETGCEARCQVCPETEIREAMLMLRSIAKANLGAGVVAEPEPWQPIETAPKHQEVLVWRHDSGPFIAEFTTADAVMSDSELEAFPDDFEEWFSAAYGWQEGSEKPTHWQPLPASPATGEKSD